LPLTYSLFAPETVCLRDKRLPALFKKTKMGINLVIYFSLLFFLSELILKIKKRSGKNETKVKNDKKSLIFFWVAIPLSLTVGFFTADYHQWTAFNDAVAILGIGIFFLGIILRWISIVQLDKGFTVDVAITKNHNLKTDGMYRHVRHPSYLGLFLICFGLSVSMNSLLSMAVISVSILAALIYRIKVEETTLIEEFGDTYTDYMKKTSRLIPGLY